MTSLGSCAMAQALRPTGRVNKAGNVVIEAKAIKNADCSPELKAQAGALLRELGPAFARAFGARTATCHVRVASPSATSVTGAAFHKVLWLVISYASDLFPRLAFGSLKYYS